MNMLELNNVHAFYGGIHALQGISLYVDKGEIVALIGSNGAGKSTTLRVISGLLRPKEGVVTFEGQNLVGVSAHSIVEMGVGHVPEGRRVFPRMSVQDNLEVGAYTVKDKKQKREGFERVLALFPWLKERLAQRGGTLSGGEQQMVAIGRAIMMRPKLLILDEPSMGLAPLIVEQIFQIITDLNAQGTTILLVEQNANQALKVAHRGYVIQTGTITMSASAADLLENELVKQVYLGI